MTEKEKQELNEQKQKEKIILQERIRKHKELEKLELLHSMEDKIAPEGVFVSLKNVNKIYPNHVQAVFDFNLDIKPQEFIVFVGPSGCGKSTTLRMIAGLEDITYGDLFIDGLYCNDLQPNERNLAMVFQSYALYPHMTVYKNLAFGLKMRHTPKDIIDKKVKEVAEILNLTEYLSRKPNALSGGQCQRVALGRAIVRDSKLFLMDEPLSNLDAKLRVQMRSEIVKIHNKLKTTTIYVTHDQTEAMTMANRIVVMSKGHIQQIGTPKEIYNSPANTFVASFIGSPAMNLFTIVYDNGHLCFAKSSLDPNENKESHLLDETSQEKKEGYCYTFKLPDTLIEKHDKFYSSALETLKEEIRISEEAIKVYDESVVGTPLENDGDKLHDSRYIDFLKLDLPNKYKLLEEYQGIIHSKCHKVKFGIRPEDIIQINPNKPIPSNYAPAFKTRVILPELLGREYYIHFKMGEEELISRIMGRQDIERNEIIALAFLLDNLHLFDLSSTKLIF